MENIDQVFDENITSTGCPKEHKMDGISYHRDFIILHISAKTMMPWRQRRFYMIIKRDRTMKKPFHKKQNIVKWQI